MKLELLKYYFEKNQLKFKKIVKQFDNPKKIKSLNLPSLKIDELKKIKNFENLNQLKISTASEKTSLEKINERDFLFLKHMKKLKILDLDLPLYKFKNHNINYDEIVSYFNPNIERLTLSLQNSIDQPHNTNILLKKLFKKLTKLSELYIIASFYGFIDEDNDYFIYSGKSQKSKPIIKKWKKDKPPNPIIIDFKQLTKFENLKTITLNIDEEVGFKILNIKNILNLKKLHIINLDKEGVYGRSGFIKLINKIKTKDLEYIFKKYSTLKERFLLKHKTYIENDLNAKHRNTYNNLEGEDRSICGKVYIGGPYIGFLTILGIFIDRLTNNKLSNSKQKNDDQIRSGDEEIF